MKMRQCRKCLEAGIGPLPLTAEYFQYANRAKGTFHYYCTDHYAEYMRELPDAIREVGR